MSTSLAYLALIFISSILVSLFYWHVVRPVLMLGIRYRLFARRDELRALAVNGIENCRSFSYGCLEDFVNKIIAFMPTVGLMSFLFYSMRHNNSPSENFVRFQREASKALLLIRDKSTQDAILMMIINSPIMTSLTTFVALLLWLSGKINKMIILKRAEDFVGELQTEKLSPV